MVNSDNRTRIVVIAEPGLLCNSLVAFLRAETQINVTAIVSDPIKTFESVLGLQPNVIIVDMHVQGALALITQLSHLSQKIRIIALSNNAQERLSCSQAGADEVFIQGFLDGLTEAVLGRAARRL